MFRPIFSQLLFVDLQEMQSVKRGISEAVAANNSALCTLRFALCRENFALLILALLILRFIIKPSLHTLNLSPC